MGLFDKILGNKKEASEKEIKKTFINWIPLTSLEQIEEIKTQSKSESILVFKHSTRCGISSMIIKRFETLFKEEHQELKVYYLDLLNYRNVSDEVGYTFQVMHQSPQLLAIKNGVSVYNASHYEIAQVNLSTFI